MVFSFDNGPWAGYGNHAGKTPFREAKATGFDGGLRSATIIKYPGKVRAGTRSGTTLSTVDLMPTLAGLTGSSLPDYEIDGRDVWPLIVGSEGAENPHRYYPFSTGKSFEGIISGDGHWKLHLPHGYSHVVAPGNDGAGGKYEKRSIELSLFDLDNDPNETTNVIHRYPEIADELKALAESHRQQFYSKTK